MPMPPNVAQPPIPPKTTGKKTMNEHFKHNVIQLHSTTVVYGIWMQDTLYYTVHILFNAVTHYVFRKAKHRQFFDQIYIIP